MITDIHVQHFRSYSDESFEFSPTVNIIVGPNASGKTNLLEAILVLCHGSSYRAKDVDLVQFGAEWSRLDAHAPASVRTLKLVTEPPSKAYEINGKTYRRLPLAQTVPVVLFEPNHLALLSGSPEQRRSYLDDLLEYTEPSFGTLRRQYRRTLAQRNALLKKGPIQTASHLFPWDVRLSELAGKIVRSRTDLVAAIAKQLPDIYTQIAQNRTDVSVLYRSGLPTKSYESAMLKKLTTDLSLDIARGFTGTGPHRDDFEVLFDGKPAVEVASRGETRTAVLGLKIIELSILEKVRQQKPILLLDDVFSELDGARRHALTSYLKDYQTFITTTDADVVLQHFINSCTIIPLPSSS